MDAIALWRDADCFGRPSAPRWAGARCSCLPSSGVPDQLFEAPRGHFTEEQIVALTLAIVAINSWNRLNAV